MSEHNEWLKELNEIGTTFAFLTTELADEANDKVRRHLRK